MKDQGGQFLKTTDRGVKYPVTPGHEITGKIESIGEEAEKLFAEGDKVLVYPWIGDRICPAYRIGEENLCDKPKSLGIYTDGGYSDHVLVPSYRYLIKLEDDLDINEAATLSCSALTAYNAVKNAGLRPDDTLVVVGPGGLGLMAMQLAKAVTGSKIIAIDLEDEKLKQARKDGHADDIVNSKKDDPIKTVMELTDKKGMLEFVNVKSVRFYDKLVHQRQVE